VSGKGSLVEKAQKEPEERSETQSAKVWRDKRGRRKKKSRGPKFNARKDKRNVSNPFRGFGTLGTVSGDSRRSKVGGKLSAGFHKKTNALIIGEADGENLKEIGEELGGDVESVAQEGEKVRRRVREVEGRGGKREIGSREGWEGR